MKLDSIIKAAAIMIFAATVAVAQVGPSAGNSERFDSDDVKTITGMITRVDHPVATFKSDDGTEYRIHMGPFWFWENRDYSLKANTKATIKGETEIVKGTHHFYPWEIVQDGKTLTLADDDGVPSWAGKRGGRGYGKGNGIGRGRGNWGRGCGRCCG